MLEELRLKVNVAKIQMLQAQDNYIELENQLHQLELKERHDNALEYWNNLTPEEQDKLIK